MDTTDTTPRDAFGFELVQCSRCSGLGKYSYNAQDGDRCYGCNGTGMKVKSGRNAKARAEVIQVVNGTTARTLLPGDQIAHEGKWRTVATIEWLSAEKMGSGTTTSGGFVAEHTALAWTARATFVTGGELVYGVSTNPPRVRGRMTADRLAAIKSRHGL